MKEGFTFNLDRLKFLRKIIFKNFGGGGKTEKNQTFSMFPCYRIMTLTQWITHSSDVISHQRILPRSS